MLESGNTVETVCLLGKRKADMIIYTTEDGLTKVETTFDGETVWLSIDQMAELFQRDRSVIGKHVRNIFKEGELEKESVWAKFAYTATDGKVYNVDYYNLDVIISVGYRVKSKQGTQFRIWATGILKEYMRKGFALDDDRLKNLGGGGYFKELLERIHIRHKQLDVCSVILCVFCDHNDRGKLGHGFKRPDDADHVEIIDGQILLDQRSTVRKRTDFIMICFDHIEPP